VVAGQAAAKVAPRGLYVCGNGSTTAGLTVSVVQDVLSGDFSVEAGALVLASGGICCIDELDKLRADHKV
jgi:DNA helicase MCM8